MQCPSASFLPSTSLLSSFAAKVFHRDLKPKNILANSDCKLKVCDFGLARPSFNDMPTTIFWTDYVATRWYRAPELCGSFFAKYSPAIDIWSIGCIFAEILLGKPLFPGRNVVHQLELITDLLGTPSPQVVAKVRPQIVAALLSGLAADPGSHCSCAKPCLLVSCLFALCKALLVAIVCVILVLCCLQSQHSQTADWTVQVRNEKARRFLMNMRKKPRVNFEKYFVKADRGALRLLQRMLAFDPVERPTCEEALADPYFNGLSQPGREPSAQPVSKLSFEFERRKLTTDEVCTLNIMLCHVRAEALLAMLVWDNKLLFMQECMSCPVMAVLFCLAQ